MAKRTIHGVNFQTLDQILVGGGHGIVRARSMALHRIIERAHGDVDFHWRGSGVGPRGQKAEQGKAKSADQQNQNGDDNPQNEVAHFKSSEQPGTNSFSFYLQGRGNRLDTSAKVVADHETDGVFPRVKIEVAVVDKAFL